jgi:hypothetical protein
LQHEGRAFRVKVGVRVAHVFKSGPNVAKADRSVVGRIGSKENARVSVESDARKIMVIVFCPFKTMDATGSTRAILRRLAGRLLVCVASFI